jgi:hypothetical protein
MKEKESKDFSLRMETGLNALYTTFQLGEPNKKIRKIFAKSAKKISREIKQHLKEEAKREAKTKKAELKALRKKQEKEKLKSKPVKRSKE